MLVVEYGYIDNTTTTLWPYYASGTTVNAEDVFSNLVSVPQPGFDNQTFSLAVGSVVGGGSIVNGMAFDRGTQPDYDAWGALGNEGWDWDSLLTYFKKVRSDVMCLRSQQTVDREKCFSEGGYKVHFRSPPLEQSCDL